MDTSRVYIKMCQAAEELQKLWKPAAGDMYYKIGMGKYVNRISMISHMSNYQCTGKRAIHIWLPRQDQLQALLLREARDNPKVLMMMLLNDVLKVDKEVLTLADFTSFEQLWLSFVMKNKFNKVWKDTKWEDAEQTNLS